MAKDWPYLKHEQALNYLVKMQSRINFLPYLPVPASTFFSFEAQANQRHNMGVCWEEEMHRYHGLCCSQELEMLMQGPTCC